VKTIGLMVLTDLQVFSTPEYGEVFLCSIYVYVEGVDEIMETLKNWEIEFVLAALKDLQLSTLNVLPFVYTL
jgi:hypothetical protein